MPRSAARRHRSSGGLDLSARNQLRGRVVALTVEGLMAEVRIGHRRPGAGRRDHPRARPSGCGLGSAMSVFAVIKSTEVMIGKGTALA